MIGERIVSVPWKKVALILLISLFSSPAWCGGSGEEEKDAAQFFAENTVTFICATSPGGGTDYMARLVASYWGDVTGGAAKVKDKPGGGGVIGVNAVIDEAADGLTVGVAPLGYLITPVIMKDPGSRFKAGDFAYLGLTDWAPITLSVGLHVPAKSITELQQIEGVKFGGKGKTDTSIAAALACELLQLQAARVVTGYEGVSEIALATGRGELDALTGIAAPPTKPSVKAGWPTRPWRSWIPGDPPGSRTRRLLPRSSS